MSSCLSFSNYQPFFHISSCHQSTHLPVFLSLTYKLHFRIFSYWFFPSFFSFFFFSVSWERRWVLAWRKWNPALKQRPYSRGRSLQRRQQHRDIRCMRHHWDMWDNTWATYDTCDETPLQSSSSLSSSESSSSSSSSPRLSSSTPSVTKQQLPRTSQQLYRRRHHHRCSQRVSFIHICLKWFIDSRAIAV